MLNSSRLCLRDLEPSDLNANYLGWLKDPEVNRYLETRFLPQTQEALQAYWQAHRDDPASPWFAICLVGDGRHIGNIKLGLVMLRNDAVCLNTVIKNLNGSTGDPMLMIPSRTTLSVDSVKLFSLLLKTVELTLSFMLQTMKEMCET